MIAQRCVDCRCLTDATRCPGCLRVHERARTRAKRERRPYTYAEQQRRAAVVALWRAERGDWCPGWGRTPHGSADLTADHDVPVGAGGPEGGSLSVLCRSCNSAKQAHVT